jgi:hypothetical protein
MQSRSCFYCDQTATLLCDFTFGWPIGGYARGADGADYPVRALRAPYTCDMPVCRNHAELMGTVHIKAKKPLGGFDTRDYCLEHRGQPEPVTGALPEAEADRLRRSVVAMALRRLMRERGSEPLLSGQRELF